MATQLTFEQYKATTTDKMFDLTDVEAGDSDFPANEIWEYVTELVGEGVVPAYVLDDEQVEKMYRTSTHTFDHVILATDEENEFIDIIIDLETEEIVGHYKIDVNQPII